MQFDWTISIGNILTFGSLLATAIWFITGFRVRLDAVESDLKDIKETVRDVSKHVIESIVTAGRVLSMDERLNLLIQRVDALYRESKDRS